MNAREVALLLAEASKLDARMSRQDPGEAADRAESWAVVLADVSASVAVAAMRAHYQGSREVLMPADVLAFAVEHGRAAGEFEAVDERVWVEAEAAFLGLPVGVVSSRWRDMEWLEAERDRARRSHAAAGQVDS